MNKIQFPQIESLSPDAGIWVDGPNSNLIDMSSGNKGTMGSTFRKAQHPQFRSLDDTAIDCGSVVCPEPMKPLGLLSALPMLDSWTAKTENSSLSRTPSNVSTFKKQQPTVRPDSTNSRQSDPQCFTTVRGMQLQSRFIREDYRKEGCQSRKTFMSNGSSGYESSDGVNNGFDVINLRYNNQVGWKAETWAKLFKFSFSHRSSPLHILPRIPKPHLKVRERDFSLISLS